MAGGGDLGFYIGSYANDAAATLFLTSRGYTQARGYEYWDSTLSQLKKWDGAGWYQLTGVGASSPWTEAAGVLYPITSATDDVVIGAAAMSAGERLRVVGGQRIEKSDSQADDALYIQASGSHPVTENAVTIDVDVADLGVAALLIDSEVDNTSANGSPLIQLEPLNTNPRGDIAFTNARTGDPSSPSKGDLWWNTTAAAFKYYDGVSTQTISAGGTSPWSEAGAPSVLYPTTYATDDVVIGDNAMVGNERLLVVNKDPASGDHVAILAGIDTDDSTVTIDSWVGVQSSASIETNDTLTDAKFFSVGSPIGGGTITTAYGIRIEDIDGGGPTVGTSYGIYQDGDNDYNYFAGNFGIGTAPSSSAVVKVEDDLSLTASTIGLWTYQNAAVTGTKSDWTGLLVQGGHSSTGTITTSYGVQVGHTLGAGSAGAIGSVYGYYTSATLGNASDTVTTYRGVACGASGGSGTITTAYGIDIEDQGLSSTVTYGIRIQDQSGTTAYGVYQEGADDPNYFAGNTGVGITPFSVTTLRVSTSDNTGNVSSEYNSDSSQTSFSAYKTVAAINGGHTLTTYRGVEITSPTVTGTLTNSYGVIITAMNGGTLSYGIYQSGAADQNYFAGQTGVGSAAMAGAERLRVQSSDTSGTPEGALIDLDSGGSLTSWSGLRVLADVNSGHTVTTSRAILLDTPTGTGTVTTAYGIDIEDQGRGSTTTYGIRIRAQTGTSALGIYQQGTSEVNQLNANTGIGRTAQTTATLSVEDDQATGSTEGIDVDLTFSGGSTKTYSTGVNVLLSHSGTADITNIDAFHARADFSSSGDGEFVGLRVDADVGASATPTFKGLEVGGGSEMAGSGTIGTAYGVRLLTMKPATGTLTTGYGVYIGGTGGTTDYGIYAPTASQVHYFNGQIGIGTGALPPATSAALEISSTTRALIVSQMTTTERNAMTAATGMIIFNTTTTKFEGYTGSAWAQFH